MCVKCIPTIRNNCSTPPHSVPHITLAKTSMMARSYCVVQRHLTHRLRAFNISRAGLRSLSVMRCEVMVCGHGAEPPLLRMYCSIAFF